MTTNVVAPTRREIRSPERHEGALESLQREVDRLFDRFTHGFSGLAGFAPAMAPTMDISETDKAIELTVELPGLEEKDVQISMAGDVLTIRGEKKSEREEADKDYRLVERSFGSFSRSVELPAGVDPATVTAIMSKGVLKITAPKPAAQNAKRIEIKSAA